eukprot:CAMPEP_0113968956 /NCGR_PEP_ID=MMETSP0011_2-20120614/9906_1 /TAXON_ID=101924 /ORGANISM="Rhodosorus marinus" /LENGTH=79 /DNA_ID=CAMNT_0000982273 /DNA_START=91 /DNA_END=327 /DNA_ORIENTATION=+ /assembly_acc=CAM_ASM_000156
MALAIQISIDGEEEGWLYRGEGGNLKLMAIVTGIREFFGSQTGLDTLCPPRVVTRKARVREAWHMVLNSGLFRVLIDEI